MSIEVCKFCKSDDVEAAEIIYRTIWAVVCHRCSARGPARHSRTEAVKAWNKATAEYAEHTEGKREEATS